jgi:uncharacterized membrane protein (UPF0136 family)
MGQVAVILLLAAAGGGLLGYRRAWSLVWLGAAIGAALLVASRFASNNGVDGSEDLGWSTALVWLGILLAAGFYIGVVVGAVIASRNAVRPPGDRATPVRSRH